MSLDNIVVTPSVLTLLRGRMMKLTARGVDDNGADSPLGDVVWTSSNTLVATVNSGGVVKAVGTGTATITATSGSVHGSAMVSVVRNLTPRKFTIDTGGNLFVGLLQSLQLNLNIVNEYGEPLIGLPVEWSTSDNTLAVVDSEGVLTGLAVGTVRVYATIARVSSSVDITTGTDTTPVSVTVSPNPFTVTKGSTLQLTAQVLNRFGVALSNVFVAWSSSDATVATVDSTGLVTGVDVGTVQITATVGALSDTADGTVAVSTTPASVSVSPATPSVVAGATVQLTATVENADGDVIGGAAVTWSSDNASVATVDANGLVSAVSVGSCTITAASGSVQGTAALTVTAPVVDEHWTIGDSLATAMAVRGTTATYRNSSSGLATAAANVARDNHYVGAQRTLLLERAATNYHPFSDAMDNAYNTDHRCTVVANDQAGPDGVVSAERTVEDTTDGAHIVLSGLGATPGFTGNKYAFSLFSKKTTRPWHVITADMSDSTKSTGMVYDPVNLVMGVNVNGNSPIERSLESYQSGWVRAAIGVNFDVVSNTIAELAWGAQTTNAVNADNTTLSFTGDGASGGAFFGVQVEDGPFPTSYIPTGGSSASRAADVLSWDWSHGLFDMTAFARFKERGTAQVQTATVVALDVDGAASAHLYIETSANGRYQAVYSDGLGNTSVSEVPSAPAWGDDVRLRVRLTEAGAVQLFQSLNGGAETSGPLGVAIGLVQPAAGCRLWLNSDGNGFQGVGAYMAWRVMSGDQAMSTLDLLGGAPGIQPPTNIVLTQNGTTVTVDWTVAAGAASYNLYRRYESGGYIDPDWILIDTNTPKPTDDTGLVIGATYHYALTSVDANGVESALSAPQQITLTSGAGGSAPTAPSGLAVTVVTNRRGDLSWALGTGQTSVEVHRSTVSGFTPDSSTRLQTLAADAVSYSDQTVPSDGTYYYLVVAVNTYGSTQSNQASATYTTSTGSANYTNQPASTATTCVDVPFNSLTGTGYNETSTSHMSIITDGTAPKSPSNVLQILFPTGFSQGSGPGTVYTQSAGFPGSAEFFCGVTWKYNVGWQYHCSGYQKILYCFYSDGGSDFVCMHGTSDSNAQILLYFQNKNQQSQGGAKNYYANVGDAHIGPGEWVKIEWWQKRASVAGASDGAAKVWVNGVLTHDFSNVPTAAANTQEAQIAPIWGGNGCTGTDATKQHDDYYWIDHWFVARV